MTLNFIKAFTYLIGDEGSVYTNKATDTGGPTKFGITQRAYEQWIKRIATVDEIKNMTIETAQQFYFETRWTKLSCELLTNVGVAIAIFDSGVLYGIGTVALIAQRAAKNWGADLKLDGNLGEKSAGAINTVKSEDFIRTFQKLILERIDEVIESNPKQEVNREGWTNRATRLLTLINFAPVINETT